MNIINTPNMPKANGHYSQCVEHNGTLYLSGQLPLDLVTRAIPETIEAQTILILNNIEVILKEAGVSRNEIIQVRLYISDVDFWGRVNEVYSAFFGAHKPARAIIPTKALHFGCLVEIEVVAAAKA